MKNTYGNALRVTIFGESHGAGIGAVVDGLTPGLCVDEAFIDHQLTLRRPAGSIATARRERDAIVFLGGVYNGKTTGAPLCIFIPNEDTRSRDYALSVARPSHADYTADCKYHGYQDGRGGGHFSGRLTAALVAVGAILIPALREKGIEIGTHLLRCAGESDVALDDAPYNDCTTLRAQLRALNEKPFAVLDEQAGERMIAAIEAAKGEGDSVGGVLESAIVGLPAGLGGPWFDTLESCLSHALFSIPAVKGVAFGDGFEVSELRGSQANDALRVRDGSIVTKTNHSGGICGGISNGMPVRIRCAIKPTPSISKEQQTVDFVKREECNHTIHGRHDPCIVHRARVVVDSVCAMVIADALLERYGEDALSPMCDWASMTRKGESV